MPGNVILSITVPDGTCYESPAVDWPLLVSLITANLTGSLSTVNSGSATPAAADRNKPWLRSNADGSDDGQWTFYGGFWVQKHPLPTGIITLFLGALADIDAFDGGESAVVTNLAGPFWSRATEFDARSPIGPGTLPSGTVISVLDNLGEEKHVLIASELPVAAYQFDTTDGAQVLTKVNANQVGSLNQTGSLDYGFAEPPENIGGGNGHNTIGPSVGAWFIKRTARLYRRRNA